MPGYHKKNVLQNIIYFSMLAVMTHRVGENKFKRLRPAINLYLTARNIRMCALGIENALCVQDQSCFDNR